MTVYRRRTEPIHAVQYDGKNAEEVRNLRPGHYVLTARDEGCWATERGWWSDEDFRAQFEPVPVPAEESGWVAVSEWLPEQQRMVLIHSPYSSRGQVQYGYYGTDGKGKLGWWVHVAGGYEPATHTGNAVTFWRALPAPPTKETE